MRKKFKEVLIGTIVVVLVFLVFKGGLKYVRLNSASSKQFYSNYNTPNLAIINNGGRNSRPVVQNDMNGDNRGIGNTNLVIPSDRNGGNDNPVVPRDGGGGNLGRGKDNPVVPRDGGGGNLGRGKDNPVAARDGDGENLGRGKDNPVVPRGYNNGNMKPPHMVEVSQGVQKNQRRPHVGTNKSEVLLPHTVNATTEFPPGYFDKFQLSEEAIESIEKFVLFLGWPRSGHSIIGSMLDAHPNAIISNEFLVFTQWIENKDGLFQDKRRFLNKIYKNSVFQVLSNKGYRNSHKDQKGYTLSMKSLYQGNFTELKVIGDKSGGFTAREYATNPTVIKRGYHELEKFLGVPIRVIFMVRNPYDMIATRILYEASHIRDQKLNWVTEERKYTNKLIMQMWSAMVIMEAMGSMLMMKDLNLTVLEIHLMDFIADPRGIIQQLCDFLDLECSEGYLQACQDKTFNSLSKTRHLIDWGPQLHTYIDNAMKQYPFFERYSFDVN